MITGIGGGSGNMQKYIKMAKKGKKVIDKYNAELIQRVKLYELKDTLVKSQKPIISATPKTI